MSTFQVTIEIEIASNNLQNQVVVCIVDNNLPIDDVAKDDVSIATCTSHFGAIIWPCQI